MSLVTQISAARELLRVAKQRRDEAELEYARHLDQVTGRPNKASQEPLDSDIVELPHNFPSPTKLVQLQGELEAEKFHAEILAADLLKSQTNLDNWGKLVSNFENEKRLLIEEVGELTREEEDLVEALDQVGQKVDMQIQAESESLQNICDRLENRKLTLQRLREDLEQADYDLARLAAEAEYSAICDDFQIDRDMSDIRETLKSLSNQPSPMKSERSSHFSEDFNELAITLDKIRNCKYTLFSHTRN